MTHRNPVTVFLLSFITFGIYTIVWAVKTKNEMNQQGAEIPTAWLMVIPLVSIYWLWKYCQGVQKVTGGKMSGVLAFILLLFLGGIAQAILQNEFNKVGTAAPALAPTGAAAPPPPAFTPAATPFQPTPLTAVTPAAPAAISPNPPTDNVPTPPTQIPPVV